MPPFARLSLILIFSFAALAAAGDEAPTTGTGTEPLVKDRRAVKKFVDDLLGSGPAPSAPPKASEATASAGK